MKCPYKPKFEKYISKQSYCYPVTHVDKDFAECDKQNCMAYSDGTCKLISKKDGAPHA
jgi:hypothetical protein